METVPQKCPDRRATRRGRWGVRLLIAVVLLAMLYGTLLATGLLERLDDAEEVGLLVETLGFWGPVGIVLTMALAIVLSPLPSAPIALAAGAAYGHTWGTVYVVAGAELGALAAFALARVAGYDLVCRFLSDRLRVRLEGSQRQLAWTVFATRLMPFVSFDAVSYLAGLTPLAFWRFALATLAGIVPASFVLAHFGGALARAGDGRIQLLALGLGLAVLVPALGGLLWRLLRRNGSGAGPD